MKDSKMISQSNKKRISETEIFYLDSSRFKAPIQRSHTGKQCVSHTPIRPVRPRLTDNRAARTWTFSNVIAGSDSTTVVMRTTMYNLLAHKDSLQRLQEELRQADETTGLTRPFPSWNEVKDLPYLDACVQEAVRLHPPFCLPLERVAPAGGVTIGDRYFPGGTQIGMNPYVINRHRPTFGEDAEYWRPERWLVDDSEHRRKLEGSVMTVRFWATFDVLQHSFKTRSLAQADAHVWGSTSHYWKLRSLSPHCF